MRGLCFSLGCGAVDNLTHGLLGLAIGAALPQRDEGPKRATRKAMLLAALVAAELPDLDALWPAENAVLHALQAHRGLSHALVFTPVIAGVATAVGRGGFREARWRPVALAAMLSVLFAHLLADLWTGWGTRLLLPFSSARLTLDWAMVVDPLVTLPLVAAAIWGRRPERWRRAALVGLIAVSGYLGLRIGARAAVAAQLAERYPTAERVEVFPAWFSVWRWRYVAVLPDEFVAGEMGLWGGPDEQAGHVRREVVLPGALRANATVRATLAWARLPVVSVTSGEGTTTVRVGDLRYHLRGQPTLAYEVEVDGEGRVVRAELDRGGGARELLERWRRPSVSQ